MNPSITNENESVLLVSCEYFPKAIQKIKRLGTSKWEPKLKGWLVSRDYIEEVKNILIEFYGTDGSFPPKKVNLELEALEDIKAETKPIIFSGKLVAQAFHRDSGAKVGENVALLEGNIDSGGSKNYWQTIIEKGSRFKLMHVNEQLLQLENNKAFAYKVIAENGTTNVNRLRKISDEELVAECVSRNLIVESSVLKGGK